ncbi:MAG: 2Fe-2S iron-sulfur cluster-binding protein [Ignavibacteriaceae bacterium]|nr:2Fe-2S iron-sulfur cluster-binding protein [Ignavibacteriaceae bacterium]
MPKFVLDGIEIEFTQGQTIMEAAKAKGITIPHFCWHPELSISGNCRVCLVEVEKMPKLVIACSTLASDGMVVFADSDKAVSARNAVMEFLLINHPLDCPICDEAGECKLQDYAYSHSTGESRFVEEKVHKPKRVPLGPRVMFDAERCISCSRCIRFCDEIAKDPELTFVKRGDRVTIETYPGRELDNPYSMNVVDICPVGALTSRDFRFKARVWELSSTKSVCYGCARGCNTEIWVRNNEVLRLTPRYNKDVNSYWMCDHGRINTFKFVNDPSRVDGPFMRHNDNLIRAGWDEALSKAVSVLKHYTKEEIGFIASPYATCEDNFLFAQFAKNVIGSKHIDFMRHYDHSFGDDFLKQDDISPNSKGVELVGAVPGKGGLNFDGIMAAIKSGRIKALYILEDDIVSANPEFGKILSKLDLLIVHATNFNKTTDLAEFVFPASTYTARNGIFVNFQGRAQRIRPAASTIEQDRSLDGMSLSRLDKFGTQYDSWATGNKRDARSSWKILQALMQLYGIKQKYSLAEDVFLDIAKNIKTFHGLNYEIIGDQGSLLNLVVPETAVKV